jgi:hypothetical protein
VGDTNDSPHWNCQLPPGSHEGIKRVGYGHRIGCGVAEGHDANKATRMCRKCRLDRGIPRQHRAQGLQRRYQMTIDEYDALLAEQGGVCAVCGQAPGDTALHVDHDHATGRIRGLLCFSCNRGLGCFNDDASLLANASGYLFRKYESQP